MNTNRKRARVINTKNDWAINNGNDNPDTSISNNLIRFASIYVVYGNVWEIIKSIFFY